MTVINESELAQLTHLDQVLMWSIMSINASNLDSRNTYISDNAAIRSESKDFISWSVTRDDKGIGRFVFSALLPLVNPHPLKDKESLLERIWSYSPYDPDLQTEDSVYGYGWQIPTIPLWADTTERLLAHVAIIGAKIAKYARLTKKPEGAWANIHTDYWADCEYVINDSPYGGSMTIAGSLSFNWQSYLNGDSLIKCLNPFIGHASEVSCNFPDLAILWNVPPVSPSLPPVVDIFLPPQSIAVLIPSVGVQVNGEESSARDLIDSYSGGFALDDLLPDWLVDAQDNYQQRADQQRNDSGDIGDKTPKLIESLPVCKEQDPEMTTYINSLAEKIKTK
jgi:hypothetical protein